MCPSALQLHRESTRTRKFTENLIVTDCQAALEPGGPGGKGTGILTRPWRSASPESPRPHQAGQGSPASSSREGHISPLRRGERTPAPKLPPRRGSRRDRLPRRASEPRSERGDRAACRWHRQAGAHTRGSGVSRGMLEPTKWNPPRLHGGQRLGGRK